jgi:molecular chaperone DnaJ
MLGQQSQPNEQNEDGRTPHVPITAMLPIRLRTACIRQHSSRMVAVKRDYYEVLGVPRDADEHTIERAFQDRAREYHPDVVDDHEADERFRELTEAYSVLASPETRNIYDSRGYRGWGDPAFEEALAAAGVEAPRRGENVHLDLELRDFEARDGTRRLVRYPVAVRCRACMGHGSVHVADPESDLLDPCLRCDGRGVVETEQQVRLRIPAGLQDEAQLRVRGEGNDAGAGSVPGDLLVHVHILPSPKDPPFIRYAAFALLALAVVTLIVYLVR